MVDARPLQAIQSAIGAAAGDPRPFNVPRLSTMPNAMSMAGAPTPLHLVLLVFTQTRNSTLHHSTITAFTL